MSIRITSTERPHLVRLNVPVGAVFERHNTSLDPDAWYYGESRFVHLGKADGRCVAFNLNRSVLTSVREEDAGFNVRLIGKASFDCGALFDVEHFSEHLAPHAVAGCLYLVTLDDAPALHAAFGVNDDERLYMVNLASGGLRSIPRGTPLVRVGGFRLKAELVR